MRSQIGNGLNVLDQVTCDREEEMMDTYWIRIQLRAISTPVQNREVWKEGGQ